MIASTIIPKDVFCTLVAFWAGIDGLLLVTMVRRGSWLGAVITTLFASTIPMALITSFIEHRSLLHLIDHVQNQSYSFVFGDSIFLPFAAAMMALAWRRLPELRTGWAAQWWWTLTSAAVGILAGLWFHYLNDEPYYRTRHAMGSFNAPSKLFHDFGAYPALFGGLFCVGVPLIVRAANRPMPFFHPRRVPYLGFALLGIGMWLAVGIYHDMGLFGATPLDPHNLHPNNWIWPKA